MKYYTSTTEFNCGIDLSAIALATADLRARQMYVCLELAMIAISTNKRTNA